MIMIDYHSSSVRRSLNFPEIKISIQYQYIGCRVNLSAVMFLSEILKSPPISLRLVTMEFGVIQVCWLLDIPRPENSVNMKIFDDIITLLTVVYMADHLRKTTSNLDRKNTSLGLLHTLNFSWQRITDQTVNLHQWY